MCLETDEWEQILQDRDGLDLLYSRSHLLHLLSRGACRLYSNIPLCVVNYRDVQALEIQRVAERIGVTSLEETDITHMSQVSSKNKRMNCGVLNNNSSAEILR